MATNGDLEGSSVPHGRMSKLGMNVVWLAYDMAYKETKHKTIITKFMSVHLCMVAHIVFFLLWTSHSIYHHFFFS